MCKPRALLGHPELVVGSVGFHTVRVYTSSGKFARTEQSKSGHVAGAEYSDSTGVAP